MVKRVQRVRHDTAGADAFTGLLGEITIDTDRDDLRVHDAVLAGGHRIPNKTSNDLLYQSLHAILTALSGVTGAANKFPYFTGASTMSVADVTVFARTILAVANEAALKTLLNMEAGVDYQAYDADLAALAGLTSAADKLPYFDGSESAAVADFTAFARTLLDDVSAAAARATLAAAALGANTFTGAQDLDGNMVDDAVIMAAKGVIVETAAPGATYALDFDTANVFDITLDQACTFSFSNPPADGTYGGITVIIRQPAGANYTAAFPAGVAWAGGTAYVATAVNAAVDKLHIDVVDGGTVYQGTIIEQAYS